MTYWASGLNQAAASAAHAEIVLFAEIEFPTGVVRMHSRTGTITWGGNDWAGAGQFGAVNTVSEDAELRPNTVSLTLSGIDSSLMASVVGEEYHGRPVRLLIGLLNTTTLALVADPEVVFKGMADFATVSLGSGSGAITVNCESEFARWQSPRSLLYTHESQQLIYEGDRFFDMIPTVQTRVIDWTKKGRWGAESGQSQSRAGMPKCGGRTGRSN